MFSFRKVPINSVRDYWNHYNISSLPAWGYVFASVVLQNLLCRYLILQDPKLNTAIDNRRVYNLVAYFFFFNVSLNADFRCLKPITLECFCWSWLTYFTCVLWCYFWSAEYSANGYSDTFLRL